MKSRMAIIGVALMTVAALISGCSWQQKAGNNLADATGGIRWTPEPNAIQLKLARTHLSSPPPTATPKSWKLAVVLQIGIRNKDSGYSGNELWRAKVLLQADKHLTLNSYVSDLPGAKAPIKRLKDLGDIHPGDLISFNPAEAEKFKVTSYAILLPNAAGF